MELIELREKLEAYWNSCSEWKGLIICKVHSLSKDTKIQSQLKGIYGGDNSYGEEVWSRG